MVIGIDNKTKLYSDL